ncbi:MAG: hypothetical protein ACE5Q3_10890 [Alphaproteobacteria bacterium]
MTEEHCGKFFHVCRSATNHKRATPRSTDKLAHGVVAARKIVLRKAQTIAWL